MYKMASSDSTDSYARMNDLRDHWNVSLSSRLTFNVFLLDNMLNGRGDAVGHPSHF